MKYEGNKIKGLAICSLNSKLDQPHAGETELFLRSLLENLNIEGSEIGMEIQADALGQEILDSYDFLHFNTCDESSFSYGPISSTPSVTTLHSAPLKNKIQSVKRFSKFNKNNTFVTVSKKMKVLWENQLDHPVEIIQNGIDLTDWEYLPNCDRNHYIWVGKIAPETGLNTVLEIVKTLNLNLKIIGEIFDNKYFEEEIKPNLCDSIQYVGEKSKKELNNLFKGAIALINSANRYESNDLTMLASLACGVPVIGSYQSLPNEFLNLKGIYYLEGELDRELKSFLENRILYAHEDFLTSAEKFSIKSTVEAYKKLYLRTVFNSKQKTTKLYAKRNNHLLKG